MDRSRDHRVDVREQSIAPVSRISLGETSASSLHNEDNYPRLISNGVGQSLQLPSESSTITVATDMTLGIVLHNRQMPKQQSAVVGRPSVSRGEDKNS